MKERLATRIEQALATPRVDVAGWLAQLRGEIDALDGLTRPFAACDRERFGRETSRARLIDAPRARYAELT
jgi:hypothetical protein